MTKTKTEIESLANWGPAKRVETKQGPRMLRKAPPGPDFWGLWKSNKAALKAAGVSAGKDYNGNWEICWWSPIAKEEAEKLTAANNASRAVEADIDIPAPKGCEYLPYQRAGIAYAMGRPNVLIGDEMGLGKTIQAIGMINADSAIKKVLVICPASLRLNWARELKKWLVRPMATVVINGGKKSDWGKADLADCIIINYDVVKKHRARIDSAGPWDIMILDECHLLKNDKKARTKSVYGDDRAKTPIAPIAAKRVAALTGTPILNRPSEIWTLLHFADPEGMGKNFFGFMKKFTNAHHNGYGWDFSGAANLETLQRLLREKLMVRRLKADVLKELPAKRRQVISLPQNGATRAIANEQRAIAARAERMADLRLAVEMAKASDNPADYAAAVDALSKEAQLEFTEMAAIRRDTAIEKIPYVIEHLETALEEGPVVVFAHHHAVIDSLKDHFGNLAVSLTGRESMAQRQAAVDNFQNGKADLFIGQIQAAGVGITLTRSSHVVFAELDWVPGNLSQAEDRCHRIGQTDSVLVQHLVFDGSIDARMAEVVVAKQEIINGAIDRQTENTRVSISDHEAPTTVDLKPDKAAADKMTPGEIDLIHMGLRMLAGVCDGAAERDCMGFNKFDTRFGKALAKMPVITARQAVMGRKLLWKYHRQLPEEINAGIRKEKEENDTGKEAGQMGHRGYCGLF